MIQRGFFYNTTIPHNQIAGEIEVQEGYIKLGLFNHANDLIGDGQKDLVIKGQTNQGYWILFYQVRKRKNAGFLTSISHELYFQKAIYSYDQVDEDDLTFEQFDLEFIRLRDFIGRTKLIAQYVTNNKAGKSRPTGFNAKVEDIESAIYSFKGKKDFNSVEIIGKYGFSPLNNDSDKRFITISETPILRLNFAIPKNIDELISYFLSLKGLLSVILQDNVYPTSLRSKTASGIFIEVHLAYGKHNLIEKSNQQNCLFTLEDLMNNNIELPELILNWRKSSNKYAILHQNYNYGIKYMDMPLAPAMLSRLVGLESYINKAHGKVIKNEINVTELKSLRAEIKKLDKRSLLRELVLNDLSNYSKRTSLKSKYSFLVNNYSGDLNIMDDEIDLMVDIRNDLAHGNDEIDEKFKEAVKTELPKKILRLNNLALLQSLELPVEFINKVLSKP